MPGGGLLRNGAMDNVKTAIDVADALGSTRLFSMRHEFPAEWAKFQAQVPAAGQRFELAFTLRDEHYPFWSRGRLNSVESVRLVAESSLAAVPATLDVFDKVNDLPAPAKKDTLVKDESMGKLLIGGFTNIALPAPTGERKLYFATKAVKDVWVAVAWSSAV